MNIKNLAWKMETNGRVALFGPWGRGAALKGLEDRKA